MKKFFSCYNNGVTAIVSEEVLEDMTKELAIYSSLANANHLGDRDYSKPLSEGLRHLGTPIFTFVRDERFKESPWFTGNNDLLSALIAHMDENGIKVESGGFYVPFSNGCEIGIHGDLSMSSELSYVTTERQFNDAFGISRSDLLAKAEKVTA